MKYIKQMNLAKRLKKRFGDLSLCGENFLASHQIKFLLLIVFLIFFHIFSKPFSPAAVFDAAVVYLFTWLVAVYLFKFSGRVSISISLLLLLLLPFLTVFKAERWAEKTANLFFGILSVGIIQEFLAGLKDGKKQSE